MLLFSYDQNGWKNKISYDKLKNIEEFLSKQQNIKYVGHGGNCVAFEDSTQNEIFKVCLKMDGGVMNCYDSFMKNHQLLLESKVKILPSLGLIYDDEHIFVYKQKKCKQIFDYINDMMLVQILKIIKTLFENNIKIPDLFYKNFGIYKNEVYLYDYHEFDTLGSSNKYFIIHLAHLFSKYKYGINYGDISYTEDELLKDNFGSLKFDEDIVNLFRYLYYNEFPKALQSLDKIIVSVSTELYFLYKDYQTIEITQEGTIKLDSHTKVKYDILEYIPNLSKMKSLIDFGCSLGGIGCKFAQNNPDTNVVLNNITLSELKVCEEIKNKLLLQNVELSSENLNTYKQKNDVCLYFAVLHHILRTVKFDDMLKIILAQIGKYSIIELPFEGDVLLSNVMKNMTCRYDDTYKYLATPEAFIEKIKSYFTVLKTVKVDYKTNDLIRYAFVLEKL